MRCVHFIGFKDDRFWSAVKVFGYPDFIHRVWDARAKHGGERDVDDILVFAFNDDENSPIDPYTYNDSERF